MRRVPTIAFLSTLLGALSTIVIAWFLALFSPRSHAPMRFASYTAPVSGNPLEVARKDSLGITALAAATLVTSFNQPANQTSDLETLVPSWAKPELLEWAESSSPVLPPCAARGILISGWPVRAMWCSFDQQPAIGYWWFKARNGIVLAAAPSTPDFTALSPRERTLPTRIIPGGFALCILFWAAVWYLLLCIPLRVRRYFRHRRGRCVRCGYDRNGLTPEATCPECGAPPIPSIPRHLSQPPINPANSPTPLSKISSSTA